MVSSNRLMFIAFSCCLAFAVFPGLGPAQIIDTELAQLNVALDGTATSNGTLYGGWSAQRVIDGNPGTMLHGDQIEQPGFGYTIDLGDTYELAGIDLLPRQDGCCPDRLRDFRVGIHADDGGQQGVEVWGIDMFPEEDAPGGAGTRFPLVADDAPGLFEGRYIQITSLQDPVDEYELQMAEVEVLTAGGVEVPINYALHADATTNGTLWLGGIAGPPTNLTDGNFSSITHGDGPGGTTGETEPFGFYYDIDLGQEIEIAEINVWPRQDGCCPDRLTFYSVGVHTDDNGSIGGDVWAALIREDFSVPDAGPTDPDVITADLDPGGVFTGQWIRVMSLEDNPPDYRLQLAEVEVFGHLDTGGGLLGDFDESGVLDIPDIDALTAEVAAQTNDVAFDVNDDNLVDQEDVRVWVEDLKGTLIGDADLDGAVNAQDLNALALNWQQMVAIWSGGDFMADGLVNAADLNELGLRWQQSAALAGAAVPEPSFVWLLLQGLAALGLLLRGSRRSR